MIERMVSLLLGRTPALQMVVKILDTLYILT